MAQGESGLWIMEEFGMSQKQHRDRGEIEHWWELGVAKLAVWMHRGPAFSDLLPGKDLIRNWQLGNWFAQRGL